MTQEERSAPPRRWGTASALLDDDEARRRLMAAAERCIVARGTARVSMAQVADEAGVNRSTLYRYFASRDELLVELVVSRIDAATAEVVESLLDPRDAARSLQEIIVRSISSVAPSPLNAALFSERSHGLVAELELGSERVVDAYLARLRPLLDAWRADGQLRPDLDVRETVRWMIAVSLTLLGSPWRTRSLSERALAVEQYFVRAVVTP
ncbi:TetR/AcrR family transcriptional regulator [Trujillonella endophytica]|uniref:Transcriptional regulator, TetR family n=1 Tax=Trujillonella endophytica TaxID=673521 RepID=A0A1H8Q3M2_9ACTN|nr:TetR/AcrR family transcriptional regulator [Trujillella endophytica]SEO48666.1 transcriptional regulator, TetR family [Trujillella endophytica]